MLKYLNRKTCKRQLYAPYIINSLQGLALDDLSKYVL